MVLLAAESGPSILEIITGSGLVVQSVLLLLVLMSIACWAIVVHKAGQLRRAERESQAFLEKFWRSDNMEQASDAAKKLSAAPLARVFRAGYSEYKAGRGSGLQAAAQPVERVGRALRKSASGEIGALESWVPVLATVGSAAPFIGLFGTVWGIMRAFHIIGMTGETSLGILGPFISEALIATAVGLFAAIPAVMAYNYFTVRIRRLAAEMDRFSSDLLNLIARHAEKD